MTSKTGKGETSTGSAFVPSLPMEASNQELAAEEASTLDLSDLQIQTRSQSPSTVSKNDGAQFGLFPELPIEIRLEIFRHMFPHGRHVCLDAEFAWSWFYENSVHAANSVPLPQSLFINHESRVETLKHYQVVFKGDSKAFNQYEGFAERPFFFNPSTDSVYITFPSISEPSNSRHFNYWMAHLDSQLPGGTNSIRSLEIRDVKWEKPIENWIQCKDPSRDQGRNGMKGLMWFQGLEELCFTGHRNSLNLLGGHNARATHRAQMDGYGKRILKWYAHYNEKFPGGRIPQVMTRSFHKVTWARFNMKKRSAFDGN